MDKKKFSQSLVAVAIAGSISILFAKAASKGLADVLNQIIDATKKSD